MTADTLAAEAPSTDIVTPKPLNRSTENRSTETRPAETRPAEARPTETAEGETSESALDVSAVAAEDKPKKVVRKSAGKRTKTLELTLTVTGTADGEWHAELKQGSTFLVRNLTVAAAAVSRAAKELHDDLSTPIDEVIEAAREQQAAKVAALEAELEAARKALADLAD